MTDKEKFDRVLADLLATEKRIHEQRTEWLKQNTFPDWRTRVRTLPGDKGPEAR